MKRQAGIWIDTKRAVIIFLAGKGYEVETINSSINSRERIPGEKKLFSRFGTQFINFEKRKENRKIHEIQNYLKRVVNEIKDASEVVLFGPAEMKLKLEKFMNKSSEKLPPIMKVEAAESMTKNQKVAWVKKFFKAK